MCYAEEKVVFDMNQEEILVRSTMDETLQPSLFYRADAPGKRPLLVGLHTWSHDRFNQIRRMLPLAEKHGFHLLLPDFRGCNLPKNPECRKACGSPLAKQDIVDAVDFVLEREEVDRDNVFLLGLSGGAHMAFLMAGFCPERFRAIGAFSPITDLARWETENANYRESILACCGDDREEMLRRSPVSFVETIARANLKIFHGKYDRTVSFRHSLDLYEAVLAVKPDASVYLDLYDGKHDMDMNVAEYWILSQYRGTENVEITG